MVDHNMFQRYCKSITQYSKFDPQSVMLYTIPARWTNNNKAIGGDNFYLSNRDKEIHKNDLSLIALIALILICPKKPLGVFGIQIGSFLLVENSKWGF